MKTECPSCKQHYEVDESYIGSMIECSICKRLFCASPLDEGQSLHLIKCPDCGKMISFRADQCPNCGYRNEKRGNESKTKLYDHPKAKKSKTGCCVMTIIAALFFAAAVITCLYHQKQKAEKEYLERQAYIQRVNQEYDNIKNEVAHEREKREIIGELYSQLESYSHQRKLTNLQMYEAGRLIKKIEELTNEKNHISIKDNQVIGFKSSYIKFLNKKKESDIADIKREQEAINKLIEQLKAIGIEPKT